MGIVAGDNQTLRGKYKPGAWEEGGKLLIVVGLQGVAVLDTYGIQAEYALTEEEELQNIFEEFGSGVWLISNFKRIVEDGSQAVKYSYEIETALREAVALWVTKGSFFSKSPYMEDVVVDRFVYWRKETPDFETLRKVIEDYLGGIIKESIIEKEKGYMVFTIVGDSSFPFKRIEGFERPVHNEERWFEIYVNDDMLDILTRQADELTNTLAGGLQKLLIRFYDASEEEEEEID